MGGNKGKEVGRRTEEGRGGKKWERSGKGEWEGKGKEAEKRGRGKGGRKGREREISVHPPCMM